MKRIKSLFATFLFATLIAAPAFTIVAPQTVHAATIDCEPRFLLIPPWYRGMTEVQKSVINGQDECVILSPDKVPGKLQGFVIKLAVNIVEIGLVLVVYVAIALILFGGFQFLTNGGDPGAVQKARLTILHAVIGLAISLGAIAITNLIFRLLG